MNLMDTWLPISYSQQPNSTTPTTIKPAGIASCRYTNMASVVVQHVNYPVQRLWTLVPSTLHHTHQKIHLYTAASPVTTNKKKAGK